MTHTTNVEHLVLLHVVTAGMQDEDLGSDEEEIVLFAWLVIDVSNLKVRTGSKCKSVFDVKRKCLSWLLCGHCFIISFDFI